MKKQRINLKKYATTTAQFQINLSFKHIQQSVIDF